MAPSGLEALSRQDEAKTRLSPRDDRLYSGAQTVSSALMGELEQFILAVSGSFLVKEDEFQLRLKLQTGKGAPYELLEALCQITQLYGWNMRDPDTPVLPEFLDKTRMGVDEFPEFFMGHREAFRIGSLD
ncbi:hypothetical protein AA0535_1406 [Asaia krungthepensis NRIC 0535]|uniref:Uncharacterized protein n=1 Tax=Asaia krungthepensis NRIC 0535 TaxID=1307925 RepID=A0ABQ0Q2A6_9PROT|nr:hypothetical protein AA0535_1406 [Asaia krungthepensis NRIC 0535]